MNYSLHHVIWANKTFWYLSWKYLPVKTKLKTRNPDAIVGRQRRMKFKACHRPVPPIWCRIKSQSKSSCEFSMDGFRLNNFIFNDLLVVNSHNLNIRWSNHSHINSFSSNTLRLQCSQLRNTNSSKKSKNF